MKVVCYEFLLFQILAQDPDGDVMTITKIVTDPPNADTKFSFNPASKYLTQRHLYFISIKGKFYSNMIQTWFDSLAAEVGITANPGFNYEGLRQYTINFTVSDPGGHTSAEAVLNIDISDVNEPPTCPTTYHEISMNEKLVSLL